MGDKNKEAAEILAKGVEAAASSLAKSIAQGAGSDDEEEQSPAAVQNLSNRLEKVEGSLVEIKELMTQIIQQQK